MNEYTKRFIKNNLAEIVFSIPKTVWFNLKVLPVKKALRFPIVISYHVKVKGVTRENFIVEDKNLSTASLRIGFGDSAIARRESKKGLIQIRNGGKILLKGTIGLSQGIILATDSADIIFGNHFRCNHSTTIDCTEENITFGDNVVCGWNVTIRNGDGHTVIDMGEKRRKTAPITIGNHVWICAMSTILKNTKIGDNSVVAYGSLLTKATGESNRLYAGVPAKPIKDNIDWEE